MARKTQLTIQDNIETNEEFADYIHANHNRLICMEVYSDFCGNCLATGNAVRKGKLEIGQDNIAMAKAMSDKIDALSRFKGRSEPVFLFVMHGQLTRAMFGANGIELCRIIEEELGLTKLEAETGIQRPKYHIEEMLPEEAEKQEEDLKIEEEYREAAERLRVLTLAARKKRVNQRISVDLRRLNYIMFWPHCHRAHYDLYEKWDMINVTVAGKETFILDEKGAKEALYMSDVDPNEACLHALLKGEVLVVLFKMFDTDDRDFVKLMRYALYEEVPIPKEDVPPEKQVRLVTAYERYATISKTAPEVRRDRYEAKLQKLREEQEDRDRLAREQARMIREAEEEKIRLEKQRKEEEKMARLQAGLPVEPEPEEVEEALEEVEGEAKIEGTETEGTEIAPEDVAEEEKVEEEEEFHSYVSVEGEEYIPPGGLFVPGLYTPANDLAKANGLVFFYPKIVQVLTTIESENLPPHVLVMFTVDKRAEVQEVANQYASEILAMGFFMGEDPYTAEHLAYSAKQYDKMGRVRAYKDRLAIMVSRKRSLPLLQLAGLNPCYISADVSSGERECLTMFPVGYADDFVEEESVNEEEIVEPEALPEAEPEQFPEPQEDKKEENDEEGD